jgi:hypothetical protein
LGRGHLALLSAFYGLSRVRKPSPDLVRFLAGAGRGQRVVLTGGGLLGYAFLIESLVFLLSTFVLLFFLFRFIGNQKWWVVLTGSSVVTLATHLLFRVALKVQLPRGPF